MAFITLTAKFTGIPVYINPKYISDISRDTDNTYTYVGIVGDSENGYKVVESPQAIFDLIKTLYERSY